MHALNVHVAYTRPSLAKPNLNSRHLLGLQPGHTKEMGDGLTSQMGDRVRMAAVDMSVPKSVIPPCMLLLGCPGPGRL